METNNCIGCHHYEDGYCTLYENYVPNPNELPRWCTKEIQEAS